MKDTPRTDAKESETEDGGMERHAYYGWKFARALERELAEKDREIERLRSFLKEATACVADWGLYASEYFQKKHDLDGDIRRFRDALKHNPTTEKSKP